MALGQLLIRIPLPSSTYAMEEGRKQGQPIPSIALVAFAEFSPIARQITEIYKRAESPLTDLIHADRILSIVSSNPFATASLARSTRCLLSKGIRGKVCVLTFLM